MTPAEKAIYDATQAVEAAGCDVLLTEAVNLLGRARDRVADFVDRGLLAALVSKPTCSTCNDSHRMTLGEREVPCTFCPRPCEECRAFYQGVRLGAYCETSPCSCRCHHADHDA